MALEFCPRCSHKLGPPFRSGRQVCMKCAWSDRPKESQVKNNQKEPELAFDPPVPTPMPWGSPHDENIRRWLSVLPHASLFFSSTGASIVVPIILWAVSKDPVVRTNAKEALNLQITLLLYGIVFLLLILLIQGPAILLFLLIMLLSFVFPIFAIIQCIRDPDVPFTYPLIFHPLT